LRAIGVHVTSSKGLPSLRYAVVDEDDDGLKLIAEASWSADAQASEAQALANLQRWLTSRLPDDAPDVVAVKLADYFVKSSIDNNVVARTRAEGVVLSVADLCGVPATVALVGKQIADALGAADKKDAMSAASGMFERIADVEAVAVAIAVIRSR
jgi:Holliday junction resolvasome RuvABC endonuclease subunit